MRLLTFALLTALAAPASAQDTAAVVEETPTMTDASPAFAVQDAAMVDLDALLWTARPVIVFADTPDDPRFQEQIELLTARPEELIERDVVVIADTNRTEMSDIRRKLRPRGFMLVLIGKDGQVKLRKPAPWDVRELTRVIDKMPMRQQEIREGG